MTATQALRPRRPRGAGERSVVALKTTIRALRKAQDEQMRMWEAFYRVAPRTAAPESGSGGPGPTQEDPAARPREAA